MHDLQEAYEMITNRFLETWADRVLDADSLDEIFC
jgi:hypothetical protein